MVNRIILDNMNIIFYAIVIYVIIVIVIGFLTARVIDEHDRNLKAIQRDVHVLIEDLKVITGHLEDANRTLDDMEIKMLEKIDRMDKKKKE